MEDIVNHPKHYKPLYKSKPLECIDISRHLPFALGNAFKYIWRAGNKKNNGATGDSATVIDLKKAAYYIEDFQQYNSDAYQPSTDNLIAVSLFDTLETQLSSVRYSMLHALITYVETADSGYLAALITELDTILYDGKEPELD